MPHWKNFPSTCDEPAARHPCIALDDLRLGAPLRHSTAIGLRYGEHVVFKFCELLEICIKISLGKLDMGREWKHLINRHVALNEIQWLPIRQEHAQGICKLSDIHKDPFDRMLISQAKCEKMALVSSDHIVQEYPVKWIW